MISILFLYCKTLYAQASGGPCHQMEIGAQETCVKDVTQTTINIAVN